MRRSGYTVYATVRKEADAAALRELSLATLVPILCDVTDSASIAAAVTTIEAAGVPLIAVVNNAGITKDLPVEIQPLASFRQVCDVNYFGALDVTQQFLPLLRKAGPGAPIVTIGSLACWISLPGTAAYMYSGTKHALEALSCQRRAAPGTSARHLCLAYQTRAAHMLRPRSASKQSRR